jgi:hypothetical protein
MAASAKLSCVLYNRKYTKQQSLNAIFNITGGSRMLKDEGNVIKSTDLCTSWFRIGFRTVIIFTRRGGGAETSHFPI